MRIEQIMRHDPTRVGPDEPASRLIEWYANPGNRSRYTYVVDPEGALLGVVTMMEVLNLCLPPELVDDHEAGRADEAAVLARMQEALRAAQKTPVRGIMRGDLPVVRAGAFFLEARPLLRERRITALPVVDERGRLVGEITRRLLIRLLDTVLREPDALKLRKDCTRFFESGSEFFIG